MSRNYRDEEYQLQDQIQSLQLTLDHSMASRFPLTQNPHKLGQDLRKVKTLNGTGDENAVATRSDTHFQELSRIYQDYFHSDGVSIPSSLNPSVQPSSSIRKNTYIKPERQC